MSWFNRILDKVGVGNKLDRLPLEDIRKERVRLEQIDKRLHAEMAELDQRKRALFTQGKQAASQRQQVALARKIQEIDQQCKARDQQLALVSKQSRILTGLAAIKENQGLIDELGVGSVLSKMDMSQIQDSIERASVKGQFQMEKFTQILGALETDDDLGFEEEDEATLAIVAAMQEHGGELPASEPLPELDADAAIDTPAPNAPEPGSTDPDDKLTGNS